MDYKIAICDDNEVDCVYISNIVNSWADQLKNEIDLQVFPSAESFLFHYSDEKDYDILLLDIEMGKMDGVSLAKRLRHENETVQIIFITGYSDYISEGYEVAALHYLMKPVKKQKLFQTLDRAIQKIKKNEQTLFLELPGETIRLPIYEIRFLEVRQNYVTIHAKNDYTLKKTLSELEQKLDERFYRMRRSYIVNLSYISKVTKTDVFLSDGTTLPLPRGQYEPLNRAFIANT
ncbi:MAG: LytTR family DNA-binding domain-containing protein [Candidatus Paceibacterota bacterium]|jgi:DNA-binding LytR/AlgR family response regulator|nr:LytTR family DNA-binding domain-containing protein [Clostridia bacterium]